MTKDYLCQKDKMPQICPKEKEDAVKEVILEKLAAGELLYLSTLSPAGWPVTDCMHFAVVEGENKRPIIYMFTHNNVRKLENIANDQRVSVSICHTISFEKRSKSWAFQFMCVATSVTDKKEIELAVRATRAKKGYEFAAQMPLEKQPCIKVEPVFGVFTCGECAPSACSIDYLADQGSFL